MVMVIMVMVIYTMMQCLCVCNIITSFLESPVTTRNHPVQLQVGFHGFSQFGLVFHGSISVFKGLGWFFMGPGGFLWSFMVLGHCLWFSKVPGWFFMVPGGF